eukprot:9808594-Karenia_brevis.AAC.1
MKICCVRVETLRLLMYPIWHPGPATPLPWQSRSVLPNRMPPPSPPFVCGGRPAAAEDSESGHPYPSPWMPCLP